MNDSSLQLHLDREWKQMDPGSQRVQGSTTELDEQQWEHRAKPAKPSILVTTGARFFPPVGYYSPPSIYRITKIFFTHQLIKLFTSIPGLSFFFTALESWMFCFIKHELDLQSSILDKSPCCMKCSYWLTSVFSVGIMHLHWVLLLNTSDW